MNINPSAAIRQNYNEIVDSRREKMLTLREELLAAEEDRLSGRMGCSPNELSSYLDDVIDKVEDEKTAKV